MDTDLFEWWFSSNFQVICVYVVDKSTGPEPLRGCVHLWLKNLLPKR